MAWLEDRAASLSHEERLHLAGVDLGRSAVEVAPDLLGRVLERHSPEGVVGVRLTEVEAYDGPGDPGSHARSGRTPRTAVMFGPPGRLYVYFSYGMHWCTNLVCGPDGSASAVLLRAGEVVHGHQLARTRRTAARTDRDLARGPARLAQALGIDGSLDSAVVGAAGSSCAVRLLPAPQPASGTRPAVRSGPRVGVSGAGGDGDRYPWRFWLDGDPAVSPYRPAAPRRVRRGVPELPGSTGG